MTQEPAQIVPPPYKGEARLDDLPESLQARLREMAQRPNDPMRLPRPQRLPILRGFIGTLLGTALLPGLLYPQATGFFIAVASVTGVGVTFILERVAAMLPSFWYVHPSFLLGQHFGVVEVYPLLGLLSARSLQNKKLELRFQPKEPGDALELLLDCKDADAIAAVIESFAAQVKQQSEQDTPKEMTEIELFPHSIW